MDFEIIWIGFLASLMAGLATSLGGLPVLFMKGISHRTFDAMLGFAAGVMFAATAFSLIIPAIQLGGIWVTVTGFLLGAIFVFLLDRIIPHDGFIKGPKGYSNSMRQLSLMIMAITMHNFPEGIAVGVSFGGGDIAAGTIVAIAIGLQNIPEGAAVAFPLVRQGFKRIKALWYATLTGLIEPVGGLIGVLIVTSSQSILPSGLAFAAGAMAYIISSEMIPESHRKGHKMEATFGFIIGFSIMMVLDNIFG